MPKLCMSCFTKIPLLASKCPNCIERGQGVWGRMLLVILLILGIFFGAKYYLSEKKGGDTKKVESVEIRKGRLLKLLDEVERSQK